MAKEEAIKVEGVVLETLPNAMFTRYTSAVVLVAVVRFMILLNRRSLLPNRYPEHR